MTIRTSRRGAIMSAVKTKTPHREYTYQVYLQSWKDTFGDARVGRSSYLHRGKRHAVTLDKLTEEEFEEHLRKMDEGDRRFRQAADGNDGPGMTDAMAEIFPHELALLL
jgi:hypothetical protein